MDGHRRAGEPGRTARGARPRPARKRFCRWAFGTAAVGVLAALLYAFPLFHVVPLHQARQAARAAAFDAHQFAERFWRERLLPSADRAVPAARLLSAIADDPQQAGRQYGRTFGISTRCYYYLRGIGRVMAVDRTSVSLACPPDRAEPAIILLTANIFGNTIRNATGLLDLNDFPNSRDFNRISQQLNRIVEQRVVPPFRREVRVGDRVRFVGCAEVQGGRRDVSPLRLVPIAVEIER